MTRCEFVGTVRVSRHERSGAKQLTIFGGVEFARTLRNGATEALDRADEAKRKALLGHLYDGPRGGQR